MGRGPGSRRPSPAWLEPRAPLVHVPSAAHGRGHRASRPSSPAPLSREAAPGQRERRWLPASLELLVRHVCPRIGFSTAIASSTAADLGPGILQGGLWTGLEVQPGVSKGTRLPGSSGLQVRRDAAQGLSEAGRVPGGESGESCGPTSLPGHQPRQNRMGPLHPGGTGFRDLEARLGGVGGGGEGAHRVAGFRPSTRTAASQPHRGRRASEREPRASQSTQGPSPSMSVATPDWGRAGIQV